MSNAVAVVSQPGLGWVGTWLLVAGIAVTIYSAVKYWVPFKNRERTKKTIVVSAAVSILLLAVGTTMTLDAMRAESLVRTPVNISDIISA